MLLAVTAYKIGLCHFTHNRKYLNPRSSLIKQGSPLSINERKGGASALLSHLARFPQTSRPKFTRKFWSVLSRLSASFVARIVVIVAGALGSFNW